MIGLVIAMHKELKLLLEKAKNLITTKVYNISFYQCNIDGVDVVIAQSGIGKVNASFATTLLIERFQPDFIINTGIAGSLGSLKPFDMMIASGIVQHDFDTSAIGDPKGLIGDINLIELPVDNDILTKVKKLIPNIKVGIVATGDQFVASKALSIAIANQFGAVACDMEAGAVAQIAYLANVPLVVIKSISDGDDDESALTYLELADKTSFANAETVAKIIPLLTK